MSEKPTVAPYDWITLANNKSAVVCTVCNDTSFGEIEAVYIDRKNQAISDYMVWQDGKWEFKSTEVNATYADNCRHLRPFVDQLRGGRPQRER